MTEQDGDLQLFITKASNEKRYTFGPLYAPDRVDAHDDFVDSETLQAAVWAYVRNCVKKGNNRINLQHEDSGKSTIGEWVEVCTWPYETTIKVAVPGKADRELIMPAGTVYMGVVWDEKAWENGIKKGKLTGFSLGGRAVKVTEAVSLERMGDHSSPTRKAREVAAAIDEEYERLVLEQADEMLAGEARS